LKNWSKEIIIIIIIIVIIVIIISSSSPLQLVRTGKVMEIPHPPD